MLDLALFATMVLVCGGVGLPIAELLPARFAWRVLIAPALGYAVLAVAVTVTYRWGLPITYFFYGICGLAAAILAVRSRRVAAAISAERRLVLIVGGVCALATLVLLAPRWVGGDQFSVFQGNQWDTYGYLESALVYARKPYSAVMAADDYQRARVPLVILAQTSLGNRPSVHQLYAVFSRISPGQAYRLYYPFLVFSLVTWLQVAVFVMKNALPDMSPRVRLAAALAFPLGFWGQYVFDINAWSQLGSSPVLLLVFALVLDFASHVETELAGAARFAVVLAIAVAGSVFLYPEGTLVYSAALVPIAGVVLVYRIVRTRRIAMPQLVQLAGFVGAATAVLYGPLLAFILDQIRWSTHEKVTWWQFFQAFFRGRDNVTGHPWARSVDFAGGLFGLYFATPARGAGMVIHMLQRTAVAAAVIGPVAGVGAMIAGRGVTGIAVTTRRRVAAWGIASLLLLVPALRLALDENYWPAGKVVSYAAPVFVTLLCLPAGYAFTRGLRPVRWIAGAFIAFQLACGVARIAAARSSDGIHYAPPYPSVQDPALKRDAALDLQPLEAVLSRETRVLIHPMEVWSATYLEVFLYARRVPFAIEGPVNTYYGSGRDLPALAAPWVPDVEISKENSEFVLRFHDGRPALRVVSGGDLR